MATPMILFIRNKFVSREDYVDAIGPSVPSAGHW